MMGELLVLLHIRGMMEEMDGMGLEMLEEVEEVLAELVQLLVHKEMRVMAVLVELLL